MSQFYPTDPMYVIVGKLIAFANIGTAVGAKRVRYREALRELDGKRPGAFTECIDLWEEVFSFHRDLLDAPLPKGVSPELAYVAELFLSLDVNGQRSARCRQILRVVGHTRIITIDKVSHTFHGSGYRYGVDGNSYSYGVLYAVNGKASAWRGFSGPESAAAYLKRTGSISEEELAKLTAPAPVKPLPVPVQKRRIRLFNVDGTPRGAYMEISESTWKALCDAAGGEPYGLMVPPPTTAAAAAAAGA